MTGPVIHEKITQISSIFKFQFIYFIKFMDVLTISPIVSVNYFNNDITMTIGQ